jgi:hypothetical protein
MNSESISFEAAMPAAPPSVEPQFHLGKLLASLILAIATFDLCFWGVKDMGFSVAVFVAALAGLVLANRDGLPRRRTTFVLGLLLSGACGAAAVETGVTNTLALVILTIALAGDSYFERVGIVWARWYSQLVALLFVPGRIFWLMARILEATFNPQAGRVRGFIRGILLVFPALVLALVFGSLLASGNLVFGSWTGSVCGWLWNALENMFDFDRILLWFFAGFVVLPLLRPARINTQWWEWIPRLPRWPEIVPPDGAAFSSALILVVVNVLFACANAADALYLWTNRALPRGVTYSGYVHSGVNALTVTVILSALVLTGIFQQELSVARRRMLKALGLLWVTQNLFLLVSVVLRLKLYIEAYDMTVARLSVIIFLVLVAAGYVLLTIKIVREKSLPWLIGGCALAIFATFYVTQFLNLAGWSADYNVARWEKDKSRNLDMAYISGLGPAGWPALNQAQVDGMHPWSGPRTQETSVPRTQFDPQHWREFSLRAYWNRGALEDKK